MFYLIGEQWDAVVLIAGILKGGKLFATANQPAAIAASPRNALANFIGTDRRIKTRDLHEVIREQASDGPSLTLGNYKRSIDGCAGTDDDIDFVGEPIGVAGG